MLRTESQSTIKKRRGLDVGGLPGVFQDEAEGGSIGWILATWMAAAIHGSFGLVMDGCLVKIACVHGTGL